MKLVEVVGMLLTIKVIAFYLKMVVSLTVERLERLL